MHNKIPAVIDRAIFTAAMRGAGGVEGYVSLLAHRYPKQFAGLLARLLMEHKADDDARNVGGTVEVKIVSIPSGMFLTPEQAAGELFDLASPPSPEGKGQCVDAFDNSNLNDSSV
jgi:hypothetical protein